MFEVMLHKGGKVTAGSFGQGFHTVEVPAFRPVLRTERDVLGYVSRLLKFKLFDEAMEAVEAFHATGQVRVLTVH
jgi:hypothetical protein